MKITSLMINNFIGIKLLKVDKFGKLNFIEGGNGVGKSSIVKAIGEAFQSSGVKPEIIHAGEDKSEIFIKLSDGTEIQRNITATTNTVKVTQDGKTLTRPQTFLNDLFGPNVFNPVAFFNGAPAQRRAMILTAIDAKMEPDDLVFEGENYLAESGILKAVNFKENGLIVAAAIKQIVYDKRTEVGRDVTRMTKAIEQDKKELPESFDAAKWGGFNFKEKQAELANAQSNVAAYEAAKLALKQKRDEFDRAEKEIEDIQTQIAKLHDRIESLTQRQEILDREGMDIKAQIDAFTLPNIDTMTKDLDEYMKDQRLAARIESMTQRGTELETARVEHEKLDRLHEHLVKEVPARIMARANLPMDGLEIDGDKLTLNGIAIDQLSTSERVRFSVALARQLSEEKALKIILVDGFEQLDEDARAAFEAEAATDQFEYFITFVTKGELAVEPEGAL